MATRVRIQDVADVGGGLDAKRFHDDVAGGSIFFSSCESWALYNDSFFFLPSFYLLTFREGLLPSRYEIYEQLRPI